MKLITGTLVLLPLTLCLSILPQLTIADHHDTTFDLLTQVCNNSEDKNLCFSTLKSNPDSKIATLTQLGIIALRLASANGTDTSLYIKKKLLSNDENLQPALEDSLEDCAKRYLDAVEQIDNSLSALLANAYADVDVWMNAAIGDAESCEKKLKDGRVSSEPELSRRNAYFLKLCRNAMIINIKLAPN